MRYLTCAKAMLTRSVPVYVHYGITHRCNLSCRMCGLWKMGRQDTELTMPQIQQLARNLGELGTTAISLGGGEPFLRPDLPDIIRAFMDHGLEVRVLTNGLVKNEELIKRVADTGLRHISISLDTLDSAVQADICNRPGIWEEIIEAVRFWAETIRPRRGLGVLNCVVTKLNFRYLRRMLDLAAAFGFYLSLVPIELHSYQEEDLGCRDSISDMPFQPEDYEELEQIFEQLMYLKQTGASHIFNSTPYLQHCLSYLKGEKPRGFRCRAGALSFSVSPEGHYSMCHYHRGLGHADAKEAGTDSASTEEAPISAADPGFVVWYRRSQVALRTSVTAAKCRRCFRPCWQEINLAFTHPISCLEAMQLRRPHRIPDRLPTVSELRTLLSNEGENDD